MQKQIRVQHQQRGFVLIIALILMVVMAIGAITSFRLSGASEVINNNTRATVQAHQAAEAALNYCRDVLVGIGGLRTTENTTGNSDYDGLMWTSQNAWGADKNEVSSLNLPGSPPNPECLVEDISKIFEVKKKQSTDKVAAFKITARGFSPNFTKNDSGDMRTGAQSWIQFTIVRTLL